MSEPAEEVVNSICLALEVDHMAQKKIDVEAATGGHENAGPESKRVESPPRVVLRRRFVVDVSEERP
jgi:hypothetical protein